MGPQSEGGTVTNESIDWVISMSGADAEGTRTSYAKKSCGNGKDLAGTGG